MKGDYARAYVKCNNIMNIFRKKTLKLPENYCLCQVVWLLILGAFLALSLTLRGINYAIFHDEYPPRSLKTIAEFWQWKPAYTNITRITVRGATYHKISGTTARMLPSGIAIYSFDAGGNYVGWTPDVGDFHIPKIVFDESALTHKVTREELGQLSDKK